MSRRGFLAGLLASGAAAKVGGMIGPNVAEAQVPGVAQSVKVTDSVLVSELLAKREEILRRPPENAEEIAKWLNDLSRRLREASNALGKIKQNDIASGAWTWMPGPGGFTNGIQWLRDFMDVQLKNLSAFAASDMDSMQNVLVTINTEFSRAIEAFSAQQIPTVSKDAQAAERQRRGFEIVRGSMTQSLESVLDTVTVLNILIQSEQNRRRKNIDDLYRTYELRQQGVDRDGKSAEVESLRQADALASDLRALQEEETRLINALRASGADSADIDGKTATRDLLAKIQDQKTRLGALRDALESDLKKQVASLAGQRDEIAVLLARVARERAENEALLAELAARRNGTRTDLDALQAQNEARKWQLREDYDRLKGELEAEYAALDSRLSSEHEWRKRELEAELDRMRVVGEAFPWILGAVTVGAWAVGAYVVGTGLKARKRRIDGILSEETRRLEELRANGAKEVAASVQREAEERKAAAIRELETQMAQERARYDAEMIRLGEALERARAQLAQSEGDIAGARGKAERIIADMVGEERKFWADNLGRIASLLSNENEFYRNLHPERDTVANDGYGEPLTNGSRFLNEQAVSAIPLILADIQALGDSLGRRVIGIVRTGHGREEGWHMMAMSRDLYDEALGDGADRRSYSFSSLPPELQQRALRRFWEKMVEISRDTRFLMRYVFPTLVSVQDIRRVQNAPERGVYAAISEDLAGETGRFVSPQRVSYHILKRIWEQLRNEWNVFHRGETPLSDRLALGPKDFVRKAISDDGDRYATLNVTEGIVGMLGMMLISAKYSMPDIEVDPIAFERE